MKNITGQMKKWMSKFGVDYTRRNSLTLSELNGLYRKQFGITRSELNKSFIGKLSRDINILEVGSNIGNQLLLLQKMGFMNLWGIELNSYAVEVSKSRTKGINIVRSSALDMPFKDEYFDVVFTSGVLIHINPGDIKRVMEEIYRCSKKLIWGFEYYSKDYENVIYRKEKKLLWKADFCRIYMNHFRKLKLLKEQRLKYLQNPALEDNMFLLRKDK